MDPSTPGSWWPGSPPFANEDVDEPFADEPVDATTPGSWWPSSPPFANEDVDEPFADEPVDDTNAADTFHEPLAEHKAENLVVWSELEQRLESLFTAWLEAHSAEGAATAGSAGDSGSSPTTSIYTAAANDFSHLDGEPIYDNYDDNDVIYDVFADEVTAATNFVNNAPISDDTNLIPENSNADEVSDGRICTDPSPKLADLSPLNLGDEICDGDFICDVGGVLLFPTDDDNANLGLEQQQQCVESVLLPHDLLGPEQRAVGSAEAEQLLRDPAHLHAPHLAMVPQHAQSRLEVERFVRPDYYTVIKAIELGMAQDNLDAGRHVDFEYCDLFIAMLVDLELFMLQPEGKEKDDVPAVFVVNSAFQMWLSYDPSGMPATRSMKCLNILALSGGVFMVTECVIFDPGTDLTLCCTGGLQPWPPPFPLQIWYGCAMIRPLPWPSFGYRIASEHLRSAATVIILPSNQCSPWQQQQQAVCQYINFNITAYKHIFLMYCIAHMLFSIVGFPWRCSYIGNFIDALCSTSKINSLRIPCFVEEYMVVEGHWQFPISVLVDTAKMLKAFFTMPNCIISGKSNFTPASASENIISNGCPASAWFSWIWKPPWILLNFCHSSRSNSVLKLHLIVGNSTLASKWTASTICSASKTFSSQASRIFSTYSGLKSSTTHKLAKVQECNLQAEHYGIQALHGSSKSFLSATLQDSFLGQVDTCTIYSGCHDIDIFWDNGDIAECSKQLWNTSWSVTTEVCIQESQIILLAFVTLHMSSFFMDCPRKGSECLSMTTFYMMYQPEDFMSPFPHQLPHLHFLSMVDRLKTTLLQVTSKNTTDEYIQQHTDLADIFVAQVDAASKVIGEVPYYPGRFELSVGSGIHEVEPMEQRQLIIMKNSSKLLTAWPTELMAAYAYDFFCSWKPP